MIYRSSTSNPAYENSFFACDITDTSYISQSVGDVNRFQTNFGITSVSGVAMNAIFFSKADGLFKYTDNGNGIVALTLIESYAPNSGRVFRAKRLRYNTIDSFKENQEVWYDGTPGQQQYQYRTILGIDDSSSFADLTWSSNKIETSISDSETKTLGSLTILKGELSDSITKSYNSLRSYVDTTKLSKVESEKGSGITVTEITENDPTKVKISLNAETLTIGDETYNGLKAVNITREKLGGYLATIAAIGNNETKQLKDLVGNFDNTDMPKLVLDTYAQAKLTFTDTTVGSIVTNVDLTNNELTVTKSYSIVNDISDPSLTNGDIGTVPAIKSWVNEQLATANKGFEPLTGIWYAIKSAVPNNNTELLAAIKKLTDPSKVNCLAFDVTSSVSGETSIMYNWVGDADTGSWQAVDIDKTYEKTVLTDTTKNYTIPVTAGFYNLAEGNGNTGSLECKYIEGVWVWTPIPTLVSATIQAGLQPTKIDNNVNQGNLNAVLTTLKQGILYNEAATTKALISISNLPQLPVSMPTADGEYVLKFNITNGQITWNYEQLV